MALIHTLTEEPSGAYAAALPILTLPLHSIGVEGYTNRWATRDLTAANGAAVSTWTSTTGTIMSANSTANAPLMVANSSGIKALSFDGVDDALRITSMPDARTIILVARITAADAVNVSMFSGADDDIQYIRNGTNNLGIFAPGSGVATGSTETGNLWRVFGLRLGATAADGFRNGTKVVSATSTGLPLVALRLGVGGGAFAKLEVAEFVTYPTALTDAEMVSISTALRNAYPTIP